MARRRKRRIKKMKVKEVSLAFNPANEKDFIIKKDEGGRVMDKRMELLAWMAEKLDTPEVVKEELKDFAPKEDLTVQDVIKVFKELGIEVKPEVIVKETVRVDGDEVPVDDLLKEFETYKGKVEVLEKEIEKMERTVLEKEVVSLAGEETGKELVEKYYGKLEKDEIVGLAKKFAGLAKLVKDVKGRTEEPEDNISQMIEQKLSEIMKERNVPRHEAIVILGESEPELIKKWKV